MSITCTDYCEQQNTIDKPFKFYMHSEYHVYNSEWKLNVFNILLIIRGLLKIESNICTVDNGVRLWRRERDELRKRKWLIKHTKFVNLCSQLSLHFDNDTSYWLARWRAYDRNNCAELREELLTVSQLEREERSVEEWSMIARVTRQNETIEEDQVRLLCCHQMK